ncbi:hypothetical protein LCGC14_0842370, partial [marine sediment metagenome]
DGFKWIVDHVMGPNAFDSFGGANRTRTGLTIAADLGDHPTTQVIDVCDKMNLFEFLQRFGPNWDVDWRLRLEITAGKQNQMVFETFYPRRGLDKTESNYVTRIPVLINDASVNVPRARKYRETASMVNVWVKDDLSGETADAASVAAWGRRAARAPTNVSDKLDTLIENKGIEEGQEYGFHPSEQCQLGEDDDFVVGDLVTVGNAHVGIAASDQPIKGALLEIAKTGDEGISLTFGEYEKTLGDKIDEGGGGSPDDFYPDPLHGLHDNSDVWVPLSNDDFRIWIKLACVDGSLTIVGDYATNTITFSVVPSEVCYWDRNVNDAEVFTATANDDVVSNGGTGDIGQPDDRWDGGWFEALNVAGTITLANGAITVPNNDVMLAATTDDLFLNAAGDVVLTAGADILFAPTGGGSALVHTSAALYPFADEGLTSGLAIRRWSTGFFVEGDFEGDVTIGAAKGLIYSDVTADLILASDGTRFIPTSLASLAGHWTVAAGTIYTTVANKNVIPNSGAGTIGVTADRWPGGFFAALAVTGTITMAGGTLSSPSNDLRISATTDDLEVDAAGEIRFTAGSHMAWSPGGSANELFLTAAALYPGTNGGLDLGLATPLYWGTLYVGTVVVTGLVDGVNVSSHTHGLAYTGTASANANVNTLDGITSSWDVAAYPTTTASNPVRDSGGTEVYLRTFASAADAANDVNPTGEKGYIGSTPHHHALKGTSGFGTILATAIADAHTHLYDKTNTPTGAPS